MSSIPGKGSTGLFRHSAPWKGRWHRWAEGAQVEGLEAEFEQMHLEGRCPHSKAT